MQAAGRQIHQDSERDQHRLLALRKPGTATHFTLTPRSEVLLRLSKILCNYLESGLLYYPSGYPDVTTVRSAAKHFF